MRESIDLANWSQRGSIPVRTFYVYNNYYAKSTSTFIHPVASLCFMGTTIIVNDIILNDLCFFVAGRGR